MFTKIRQHKKTLFLSIAVFAVLFIYLYQELRPTVTFHTYAESGYLGKVSTFTGDIDKLYIQNHKAKYKLPHRWNWNGEDKVAFFTRNYNELFKKKDIDFWKLDVFLDEDGFYLSHYRHNIFGQDEVRSADENIVIYTEALQLVHKGTLTKEKEALYYRNRGNAYFHKREYEKAFSDYTEAIRLAPNVSAFRTSRGNAYQETGELKKAEIDFAEAEKLRNN